jgi:hypothetical protein
VGQTWREPSNVNVPVAKILIFLFGGTGPLVVDRLRHTTNLSRTINGQGNVPVFAPGNAGKGGREAIEQEENIVGENFFI